MSSLQNARRLLLAGTLVLAAASTAEAQYAPNFEMSLQGGYDRTLTALGDVADAGLATGASLGYRFSDRLVVGGDVQFHNFNVNGGVSSSFPTTLDVSMSMFEFGGFAKLYTNTSDHRFYLRGSAGLFRGRTEIRFSGQQLAASTNDPGVSGAIGFELVGHHDSATFLEASYRRIIGEDIHWVAFSVGASFFIW